MTEKLPPVERPNGNLYQARYTRVSTNGGEGWGDPLWILVLGTHDIELARKLAEEKAAEIDSEIRLGPGITGWWRDSIRYGDRYWDYDDMRGAAGVRFTEVD